MKIKNFLLTIVAVSFLMVTFGTTSQNAHAMSASDANPSNTVYDVSEHQGLFTDAQVQQLKSEVPFVILRVQQGSEYSDHTFQQNRDLMNKYGVPYGVYSYSMYESPDDAANEARTLYNRAPNARFYVNDYETQTVQSGGTNESTEAWINALRPLVGQRKILFYSNAGFMTNNAAEAVSLYDGFWLANYNQTEPAREHVLWQFASDFYSNALGQNLDASLLNSKDVNWFIGDTGNNNSQPIDSNNQNSNNQTNETQQNNNSQQSNNNQSSDNNNSNQSKPQPKPRNTSYVQKSNNMIVKDGYDYQVYNHVPGDNKFKGQTSAKASIKDYKHKSVYVNSIATVNGKTYYRLYHKHHAIGWVNTKALIPNVKYTNYYKNKTINKNNKIDFYNHIANSGFANVKVTAYGKNYANKKIRINRRAIKDGWHSYYYQVSYHGKTLGWIYQSALK
ncbi:hypothetical protein DY138_03230 [Apilactobacillus timberlakei]|uniref:GH25 family lysozyme n=1 Tax=Apilactobacillus timberlakei TaxID=2008380 RepID=UPI00112C9814|nr:GH25 family lysozyme [Apilactobacillus timberlakei]TPR19673.1 hypothetical protein DY138_03230 [Apilactobacillus timberlakei]TPR20650.1 hypothetical protein DY061_04870 [Apilactobacillus timberlakei]TPR22693.1 hypothetical protein DY083_04140 [Apilactobacillus timberlakei]